MEGNEGREKDLFVFFFFGNVIHIQKDCFLLDQNAVFENRRATWRMKGVLAVGEPRTRILSYYTHCNMPYEIKYVFNRY